MINIKRSKFTEFCGWYGMIVLILSYFLVSFGVIAADGVVFQLMNVTGAVGIMILAISKNVAQSVWLNLFWAMIGVIALINIFLRSIGVI